MPGTAERLSDTHIFDTLVAELGDPFQRSAQARAITQSRHDERLDTGERPAIKRKKPRPDAAT